MRACFVTGVIIYLEFEKKVYKFLFVKFEIGENGSIACILI